jgi:hypothetical protein
MHNQSVGKVDCVLRPWFAGVLFLSAMSPCQTAIHRGMASPNAELFPSPAWNCFGQSPVTELLENGVPPVANLGLDRCAKKDKSPIDLNQTHGCLAATTSSKLSDADLPSSDLPEAPTALQGAPSSADGRRDFTVTPVVSPTLAAGRNSTPSGRTMDREFVLLHTLSTVALIADLETTARGFEAQPKATELNPMFGARPTRARLYGIAVPLNALSLYLSYHYKKVEPRRNSWKIGPGVSIAIHTAAVINNLIAVHR